MHVTALKVCGHTITATLLGKADLQVALVVKSLPANAGDLREVGASLVAQRLKHLPLMQETWVRSLGWEDPLEKEMVTHSSILTWRIPWTEKPGRLQSMGSQRVGHD